MTDEFDSNPRMDRSAVDPPAFADLAGGTPGEEELDFAADVMRHRIAGRLFGEEEKKIRIARFRVLKVIGAGAMGVVYAAHDDELDRTVAIKVIRKRTLTHDAERLRLTREARALARLSHPNVVHVYDTGFHEGALFIVMERIEGVTLRDWLKASSRAWEDILARFVEAGRGLAAAHTAGVVHRDFKPANALVGADGRVRVVDFGLARGTGADTHEDEKDEKDEKNEDNDNDDRPPPAARSGANRLTASNSQLTTRLTRPGGRNGTPAYMSPEQHRGDDVDPRSDQFSFCVALYEALFGERPFATDVLRSLSTQHGQTQSSVIRRRTGAPLWLHAILTRGLELDPRARYPSMDALLDALTRTPARRKRRLAYTAIGLGAGALLSLTAAVLWLFDPPCVEPRDELKGVWDEDTRARAHQAFAGTELPYAERSWSRLSATLDAYVNEWASGRRAVCEMARVRDRDKHAITVAQEACFERGFQALSMLVAMVRAPDGETVATAPTLVEALPRLDHCSGAVQMGLRHDSMLDEAIAAELKAARAMIDRSALLTRTNRAGEALEPAIQAQAIAERLLHEVLTAEALLAQSRAYRALFQTHETERTLNLAYNAAEGGGDDRIRGVIARELAETYVTLLERPTDASAWIQRTRSILKRSSSSPVELVRLGCVAQHVAARAKQHEDAEQLARDCVDGLEEHLGPTHEETRWAKVWLANELVEQAREGEALSLYENVLSLHEDLDGPEHPSVASTLFNIAALHRDSGRPARARPLLERALAISTRSFGRESHRVARALTALGIVEFDLQIYKDAAPHVSEALAIFDALDTPWNSERVNAAVLLGNIHEARGELGAALAAFSDALEHEQALDPDQRFVTQIIVGVALCRTGRCREALDPIRRAREYAVATLAPDDPYLVYVDAILGAARLAHDQLADARVALERALTRATTLTAEHPDAIELELLADLKHHLARALWRSKLEPERVAQLTAEATAHYEQLATETGYARHTTSRESAASLHDLATTAPRSAVNPAG